MAKADGAHGGACGAQVYRCGFSRRLGPVALMDTEQVFLGRERTRAVANIGSELAAIALADIQEVLLLLPALLGFSGILLLHAG